MSNVEYEYGSVFADEAITTLKYHLAVSEVIIQHPEQVMEYKSGRTRNYGFLFGQAMKLLSGRADARLVNEELRRKLDREGAN